MQNETWVTAPAERASLGVEGQSARFALNRVFCVGRNYAAHAVEMGHDPTREPPFFFMKPATAVTCDGVFPYPPGSSDVHHEVELVVALGQGGREIAPETALASVWGYGVGLDMTRRDLQAEAKSLGRPWDLAKGFDASAPCSTLVPAALCGHPSAGAITLSVNGVLRQQGDLSQMTWKIPELIAELSRWFTLMPGDLIMTGTPAGVGPVVRGDLLAAQIEGVGSLSCKVV